MFTLPDSASVARTEWTPSHAMSGSFSAWLGAERAKTRASLRIMMKLSARLRVV